MTTPTIAIIGAGHMGSSLIAGLIKHGHPSKQLWAVDLKKEKMSSLKKTFLINTTSDSAEAISAADILLFAIKPQAFEKTATAVKNIVQKRKPFIISIAAGIREERIQQWLGGHIKIIRAMPNMPALIQCGATALYANADVSETERQMANTIFRAVGTVVWLNQESQLDTVTALSGSGPAYFFLFMEALQQAAEKLGLPSESALSLTLQTALGAARLAIESGKSLAELRHAVTSPGGTTEKAVAILEKNRLNDILKEALFAAKKRAEELSK